MIYFAITLKENYAEYKNENDIESLKNIAISYEEDDLQIDWDYLENINTDIIGWIYIEGTTVNYPILKDDGSQYYLYHSFDKKYNQNGSIFTFESNLFTSQEIIIYGHNMRNDAMFSQLKNFMNKDFFNNYSVIKIYTKDKNYKADIFSVYSGNIYNENDNLEGLDFNEKLEYYKSSSIYEVDSQKITKIIKLITCSYDGVSEHPTNQRYFIIANLIERKNEN